MITTVLLPVILFLGVRAQLLVAAIIAGGESPVTAMTGNAPLDLSVELITVSPPSALTLRTPPPSLPNERVLFAISTTPSSLRISPLFGRVQPVRVRVAPGRRPN